MKVKRETRLIANKKTRITYYEALPQTIAKRNGVVIALVDYRKLIEETPLEKVWNYSGLLFVDKRISNLPKEERERFAEFKEYSGYYTIRFNDNSVPSRNPMENYRRISKKRFEQLLLFLTL